MTALVLDPVPHLALRIVLALIFASSAGHKLLDLARFRAAVAGYGLLPYDWIAPVSIVLLAAEVGIVAGLLFPRVVGPAGLLAAALLAVYAGAVAINLWRGRRDIDCGCAGPTGRLGISGALVARNVVLVALALLLTLPVLARPLGWIDWFTVASAVLALALLYVAVDGLLATAPRIWALALGNDRAHTHRAQRRGDPLAMLGREVGHA